MRVILLCDKVDEYYVSGVMTHSGIDMSKCAIDNTCTSDDGDTRFTFEIEDGYDTSDKVISRLAGLNGRYHIHYDERGYYFLVNKTIVMHKLNTGFASYPCETGVTQKIPHHTKANMLDVLKKSSFGLKQHGFKTIGELQDKVYENDGSSYGSVLTDILTQKVISDYTKISEALALLKIYVASGECNDFDSDIVSLFELVFHRNPDVDLVAPYSMHTNKEGK